MSEFVAKQKANCMCAKALTLCLLLSIFTWWAPGQEEKAFTDPNTDLQSQIEELTAQNKVAIELLPGQIRLLGCDDLKAGSRVRRASSFELTIYFECLPGVESSFPLELVLSLGTIDISRIPFKIGGVQPGQVVKRRLSLYVPRYAPVGNVPLSLGFVRKGMPGEYHGYLADKMALLLLLDVLPSAPPLLMPLEKKRVLREKVAALEGRNLVANSGFERGMQDWILSENVLNSKNHWHRMLAVDVDDDVSLAGGRSLRIDFGGGQDPNFFHVKQSVPVKPDTLYTISYYIKTESITSNHGSCIVVMAPGVSLDSFYQAPSREMILTGTNNWTPVQFSFKTPSSSKTLLLQLRRHGSGPARYQPSKYGSIAGSVWFDDIQLFEG